VFFFSGTKAVGPRHINLIILIKVCYGGWLINTHFEVWKLKAEKREFEKIYDFVAETRR
jgi:hypothetical protein